VPWDDDIDVIKFPSHTSIISQDLLLEKLNENGIEVDFDLFKGKKIEVPSTKSAKDFSAFRKFKLDAEFDTGLPEGQTPLRKVAVKALDMDWLFENNNANTILNVLANDDTNNRVLTQEAIQVFLDLTWEVYQPAIIKKVFIPYLFYLCLMCRLVCQSARAYVNNISFDQTPEVVAERDAVRLSMEIMIPIAMFLMLFFLAFEVPQMLDMGASYIFDTWNFIDVSIVYLNMIFLIMIVGDLIKEQVYFPLEIMQIVGSFGIFMMWLKVFYWCRIFSSLAYYVKLILQTLIDSGAFMFMCLIVCIAFGVFFIGADQALESATGHIYMAPFFGEVYLDAVVDVYIVGALGNLDDGRFRRGAKPLQRATMMMFLLSTFMTQVVFMNMLIAIMGDTYNAVYDGAVENGLKERVALMDDHLWLIDLQKVFKNQKYVLIVKPSNDFTETPEPAIQKIEKSKREISRDIMQMNRNLDAGVKLTMKDVLYDLKQ